MVNEANQVPEVKYQEITKGDWDYLLILDACRYDCFEEKYSEYFNGDLEKRRSRGSHTIEWLSNTFPDRYPYTYVSANPYINSLGINSGTVSRSTDIDWNAKEHFEEIIDLWKTAWSSEENTVLPEEVSEEVGRLTSDSGVIAHYMQPHTPFITAPIKEEGFHSRDVILSHPGKSNDANPWRELYEEDRDQYIKYYRENLEMVLESIEKLLENIKGKIVITSDHGEAFGEQGLFGHPPGSNIPVLTTVPWLEIERE